VDENDEGKIVFHKSYHYKRKNPHKELPNVRVHSLPLVVGLATLSPADLPAAASLRISALNGKDKGITNSLNNQILEQKSEKKYEKAVPSAALRAVNAVVEARASAPVAQHRRRQGLL
jgi:hypothetical protein